MASPSSVLTQGLGSWGSASLLITLGIGIGSGTIVIDTGISIEVTFADSRLHYVMPEQLMDYTMPNKKLDYEV